VSLLNPETGERRQLTNPPTSGDGDEYFSFSPDGRNLAVVRRTSSLGAGELYVMAALDGTPKRLALEGNFIYEVAWSPDGKDVLAVVEQSGTTALYRVPTQSGQAARIVGLDDGAYTPAVSAATNRLAYARQVTDENIWSLSGSVLTQVIASTRRDFNPQFSPDESKIAFVSDRTGGWEIYVSDSQGGRVVQLTSFGSVVADGVRWSPDGRDIVFAVLQGSNRDIYVVPSDGGAARRMTTETSDEGRPSFSMDGKWIYFRSNRSGQDEIWKMPRGGGAATQVTQGGGFEPIETLDGKALYFARARGGRGLWSMPPAGGGARAVAGLESAAQGSWGVTQEGVCYLDWDRTGPKAKPIRCWNASTGKTSQMGIVEKPIFTAPPVFSVSRDGRRFLWNQTDHLDSDLVLVENFR
jgi:Tol biopolymer transport system component